MQSRKRKKVEAAGWKVGDASDFLGLSPDESAYIETKLRLSEGLKHYRQKRRFTQTELAKRIKSSQSRVAKMEAGDPSVSIDLLVRSLLALGATQKDLARLIAPPRAA